MLSNLAKLKAIIDNTWTKVWTTIKDHTFSVSVSNQIEVPEFPEIPEVVIPEYPKPIDTRAELENIVNIIKQQTQELKISPDTSATKKQLLDTLDNIGKTLSKEKKDFTPELVAELQGLRKDLSSIEIPETDLKPLEGQIEALKGLLDFSKYTRYDDLKVYINERQFEKLLKSFNVSVAAGGGGNDQVKIVGREGNQALVNSDGQLHVIQEGKQDTNNDTETPLGAGETYTGTATDISGYAAISLFVQSDQDSAANGLVVQFSHDGTEWWDGEAYTIVGGTQKFFTPPVQSKYYRVKYTNGSTPQTELHIHPMLKKTPIKWSSHNLTDNLDDGDDAELNLSVLKLRTAQNNYITGAATNGGNFKVSVEERESTLVLDDNLLISAGSITGHSTVNKFGENPSVTVNTTEDVWDGGGTYVFPTTASITHIRSAVDSATTQGMTIEIQGLDTNWNLVVQTADLDGTNSTTEVALGTALRRVFRMKVLENAVADQNIWVGATGMAAATAKAIIQAGNNQTLMAIYTVPAGKTAYMTQYYADNETDSTRKPDSARFKLWVADRHNGYEFQLKHSRSIPELGNGIVQEFKPYFKITQKSDIKISCTISGSVGEDGHPHAGFDLILVDN